MRVGLGPGVLMSYILQGLVHPARKVREVSKILFLVHAFNLPYLICRFTGESTIHATLAHRMPWSPTIPTLVTLATKRINTSAMSCTCGFDGKADRIIVS